MEKKIIVAITCIFLVIAFAFTGCKMEVNEPIRNVPIFDPYISIQPQSYSFSMAAVNNPDVEYSTPVLSVQVLEWDSIEGTLSYQWYTFPALEDYIKDQAVPVPGATGSSFTPDITPAAGKIFYYYAVVTNTNPDAIGVDEATGAVITASSIKSDIAMISFSAADAPVYPAISQNPLSSSYTIGRSAAIAALDVKASIPSANGYGMRYQWYSFNIETGTYTGGLPNGTAIQGAVENNYLPAMADLKRGDNYYYAVVSHIRTSPDGVILGQTNQYSIPAVITMQPGAKAAAPKINAQPKDILYFVGENKAARAKMTVDAVSVDGGSISYKWYWSANKTGAGTEISSSNVSSLEPDINTASAGSRFYWVVVTNTNLEVVEGAATTDTAVSDRVQVRVSGTAASTTANAVITLNPSVRHQYVRGYGGMETTWGNFFQSEEQDMELMFNPDNLGYNIWRVMIPPVNTDINEGMNYVLERYNNRYYENAKIVNKYNGYILASPWSMPKEWKSNNSINSGGHLIYAYRRQFANYLRSYARVMAANGAPIYAVSISNEPNYAGGYDGCEWTPNEMRDFFKEVGRFTQGVRGWGGGRQTPTVLTVNGESANNPNINHAAMNDPVSNAAIDMFARHVYGSQTERLWGHQNLNGREVWMTEHNINSASDAAYPFDYTWNYIWRFMNDVDLVMRLNNENAFVWWVVKRFYSFISDGAAQLGVGGQGIPGRILPRGWGLAHYSKFTIGKTRIGFTMTGNMQNGAAINVGTDIATTEVTSVNVNNDRFDLDNTSARITAFISQDGTEISLVMFTPTMPDGTGGYNVGNIEIKMPDGFVIRDAKAMVSTGGDSPASGGNTTTMGHFVDNAVSLSADRKSAFVNLPISQIISVKFIKE